MVPIALMALSTLIALIAPMVPIALIAPITLIALMAPITLMAPIALIALSTPMVPMALISLIASPSGLTTHVAHALTDTAIPQEAFLLRLQEPTEQIIRLVDQGDR